MRKADADMKPLSYRDVCYNLGKALCAAWNKDEQTLGELKFCPNIRAEKWNNPKDFSWETGKAKDQWSTGNILRYASWGISFAGGFCIGYGIMAGQADMEHGTFAEGRGVIIFGGAAAVIIGIIMEKIGNSKKDGAIELYNSESGKSTTAINIEVAPTPQGGIGLAFNF